MFGRRQNDCGTCRGKKIISPLVRAGEVGKGFLEKTWGSLPANPRMWLDWPHIWLAQGTWAPPDAEERPLFIHSRDLPSGRH